MKNQKAKFGCATEAMLTVSLHQSKKCIVVSARNRSDEEGATPTVGCKQYFEFTEEDKAQTAFDQLVKDAQAKGWTLAAQTHADPGFTVIPQAPQAPPAPRSAKPAAAKR